VLVVALVFAAAVVLVASSPAKARAAAVQGGAPALTLIILFAHSGSGLSR